MDVMYPGLDVSNWEEITAGNTFLVGRYHLSGGKRAGLPVFPCAPKLVLASKRRKTPPKDVELVGHTIWFVSDRFKRFVETVDSGAFEFVECDNSELRFHDEPLVFWACGVRRFGSFLDEANSENLRLVEDAPGWRTMIPLSKTRIAIDRTQLGDGHVFSLLECFHQVFCDEQFMRAYKALKFRPLNFIPV